MKEMSQERKRGKRCRMHMTNKVRGKIISIMARAERDRYIAR